LVSYLLECPGIDSVVIRDWNRSSVGIMLSRRFPDQNVVVPANPVQLKIANVTEYFDDILTSKIT